MKRSRTSFEEIWNLSQSEIRRVLGREVISSRIMEIVFLEAQGWGVVGPVDLDAPEKRATVPALPFAFCFY